MNDHDRRILDELEKSLRAEDQGLLGPFPRLPNQRSREPSAAAAAIRTVLHPPSLMLAVLMSLVLGGVVSVICENAVRAGNVALLVAAVLAFPVATVPLINYLRARP